MKYTHKFWIVVSFLLLLVAIPFGASAAEQEEPPSIDIEDSPYRVFVAGVPVTAENAGDVLEDGTVKYDIATNTLTLHNFTNPAFMNVEAKIGEETLLLYFSVYCEQNTHIVISGENNIFQDAVYTKGGNITADNTTLSFKKTAFLMLTTDEGTLSITKSKVYMESIAGTMSHCFAGNKLSMADSTFTLQDSATKANYSDSVFYAKSDIDATNCTYTINTLYPLCFATFEAQSMNFKQSNFDINRADVAFYAPEGAMFFEGCQIHVNQTNTFSLSAYFGCLDTKATICTYFHGLRVVGGRGQNCLQISDSNLSISMLSFADMKEYVFPYVWAEDKGITYETVDDILANKEYQDYVNTYEDREYSNSVTGNAAISVRYGVCTLKESELTVAGYDCGIYGLEGAQMNILERVSLSLQARRVALLWIGNTSSVFSYPQKYRFKDGEVVYEMTPQWLEQAGRLFICSANGDITFDAEGDAKSITDILNHTDGVSPTLVMQTGPYLSQTAIVLLILVPIGVGFIGAAVWIFLPKKKPLGKGKTLPKSKKAR